MIDEDMPHGERRRAQEVSPVVERPGPDQFKVRLVDQRRGPHRFARPDAAPLAMRQTRDFVMEHGKQLLSRAAHFLRGMRLT
jgi:hypothetical protein